MTHRYSRSDFRRDNRTFCDGDHIRSGRFVPNCATTLVMAVIGMERVREPEVHKVRWTSSNLSPVRMVEQSYPSLDRGGDQGKRTVQVMGFDRDSQQDRATTKTVLSGPASKAFGIAKGYLLYQQHRGGHDEITNHSFRSRRHPFRPDVLPIGARSVSQRGDCRL